MWIWVWMSMRVWMETTLSDGACGIESEEELLS